MRGASTEASDRARRRGADRGVSRSAVLAAPGRIEIRTHATPEPGRGEVVIRIEGCGVCASNLSPWQGAPWFDYPWSPGSPGHEGWGVVEEVGPGVATLAPGDRVATLATRAYATHVVASAGECIPLPRELDDTPFPGEPLGCALNIFERSGVGPGDTVAIVGVGFLGAVLTRLATAVGARVFAVSRRRYAREVGRECGATWTSGLAEPDRVVSAIEERTDGTLCDVVVEATGKQDPLDLAARLVRVRGRLVVAGYHQDGPRRVDMQLWNWRGLDVVNAHERDPARYVAGVRRAVQATLEGRLDVAPLLTHTYPLERLDRALDDTRDRPEGFLKAIVRP